LTQVLFGSRSGIAVHIALAVGSMLVALSAFDFGTPRWLAWIGCVSSSAFAAIFLVQNASALVGNEQFSYFANQVLGLWGEKLLLSLLTIWLVAVLLTSSRGKTKVLGFLVMAMVVCVDLYVDFALLYLGSNPFLETPAVKLPYLLPFVWLIFESRKREPRMDS
jgi:formate-dependent nitrite reductase membrane component NrfD